MESMVGFITKRVVAQLIVKTIIVQGTRDVYDFVKERKHAKKLAKTVKVKAPVGKAA